VITDDQVVTLLRDAGNDGPLPRPLDPTHAVAQARRGRTRTQALSGLAVALAAVLILTEPGRVLLAASTGGTSSPSTPNAFPTVLVPIALVLLLLGCALATPAARRLREDSRARRLLAALWGVLALLLASLLSSYVGYLLSPTNVETLNAGRFGTPWVALVLLVPVVLAVGPLLARRALRSSSIRPVSGAVWLSLGLGCSWSLGELALLPVIDPGRGRTLWDVVALAAAIAAVVGIGAAARRRLPAGAPWRRSAGDTLLLVAAGASTTLGLVLPEALPPTTRASALGAGWILAGVAALLALAVVGARWALAPGHRTWPTTGLSVAVVLLSTLASGALLEALRLDSGTGAVHPTSGLLWAGLLVVVATAALVVVDRRTQQSDVEPAGDPAADPEM
jgi:hypothetical protein